MERKNLSKKVKCKVSICNLCGRINVCDDDKEEHARAKHNGKIDVKDNYKDREELYRQIGIPILAHERSYQLTK